MQDLHTHTIYSDGINTPEEMVLAAIAKGVTVLGISDHSYTQFDKSYCLPEDRIDSYISEIKFLKKKYTPQIQLLCGMEQDYGSGIKDARLDYAVASVHYVYCKEHWLPVDESKALFSEAVSTFFKGDVYAFLEAYYAQLGQVLEVTHGDIVGHFDLVMKFNDDNHLFDPNHPRYQSAWKAAVDHLLPYCKPFEVNTGAIAKGYRTEPYPSREIQEYIISHGGKLIYTSDSHSIDTLCFAFPE